MKPIYFIGETTHSKLQSLVEQAVRSWSGEWCFESPIITCSISKAQAKKGRTFEATLADGAKQIVWLGDDKISWRDIVFSNHSRQVPKDAVATRLLSKAKLGLIDNIIKLFTSSQEIECKEVEAYPIPDRPLVGINCLSFIVSMNELRIPITILVNPWIVGFEKANLGRDVKLHKRVDCVTKAECFGEVFLNLGKYNIEVLKNLSVGDILSSDVPLTKKFLVKVNNKDVASAYLGKSQSDKAIMIQPLEK